MRASDGELGSIVAIELEFESGGLRAIWVPDVRIPSRFFSSTDEHANLQLTMTRAELDGYLTHASRSGLSR